VVVVMRWITSPIPIWTFDSLHLSDYRKRRCCRQLLSDRQMTPRPHLCAHPFQPRPEEAWRLAQPWTAGPRVDRRATHQRASPAKSRFPCPDGLPVGWSRLLRESRRRGHRDFASRGGPPCHEGGGGRRGLFEPCLGQAGGHGEFRSRAKATRSAVEPKCLSRAGCSIPSRVECWFTRNRFMTIRYPHRIRKSHKNILRVATFIALRLVSII
jgi:hypothetical protein